MVHFCLHSYSTAAFLPCFEGNIHSQWVPRLDQDHNFVPTRLDQDHNFVPTVSGGNHNASTLNSQDELSF